MPHVIETVRNLSIVQTISELESAHASISLSIDSAQSNIDAFKSSWGVAMKRLEVSLSIENKLVGKKSEKFVELINILATTERTISALKWFRDVYPDAIVRECHPSTSDDSDGSDIVLLNNTEQIIVRCEVCDVASSSAGQNGKEKKDLSNLGCASQVPEDGIRRFIATSPEFSAALISKKRKWLRLHYSYRCHSTGFDDGTDMLEIRSPERQL